MWEKSDYTHKCEHEQAPPVSAQAPVVTKRLVVLELETACECIDAPHNITQIRSYISA